jgi:hypothetical protein
MHRPESAAEFPLMGGELSPDPELDALPEPRRPGRRLTLAALSVTALASLSMSWALLSEASYGLKSALPTDLGALEQLSPGHELANTWVRGEALLGSAGAVRYGRPLESDTYRLAPVASNDKIWVQVRVPAGMEGPHFVPPTSFVGRFVPAAEAGLRHAGLKDSVSETGRHMPPDAWLLIDGEAPATTRWTLGVLALLVGFAGFSFYGLYRLLRPVKDP